MNRSAPKISHTAAVANSHTFYHVNVHMPRCSYALSRLITYSETSLQKFAVVPLNSAGSFWRPFKTWCTGLLISGQVRLRLPVRRSSSTSPEYHHPGLNYYFICNSTRTDQMIRKFRHGHTSYKTTCANQNKSKPITASLQRSHPTLMH